MLFENSICLYNQKVGEPLEGTPKGGSPTHSWGPVRVLHMLSGPPVNAGPSPEESTEMQFHKQLRASDAHGPLSQEGERGSVSAGLRGTHEPRKAVCLGVQALHE